jgi:hypothetical protein
MIEGWSFNSPPGWPKPPGSWMPPTGWQPDPTWGPVPPGWQLWVPDARAGRRPQGRPVAAWGLLVLIAVVAVGVPRSPGPAPGDPRAGGAVLLAAQPARRPAQGWTKAHQEPDAGTKRQRRADAGTTAPASSAARSVPSASGPASAPPPVVTPAPRIIRYPTCGALNRVYPNGIGLPNAVDRTGGPPVTNFGRSTSLYRLNRGHDRDHDGIACEPV